MAKLIIPNVSVGFFNEGVWHTANKSHPQYTAIEQAVGQDDFPAAAKLISLKEAINTAIQGSKLVLRGNELFFQGNVVRGILGKRILEMIKLGHNCEPLELFLENLTQNPSSRAVEELYGFMEVSMLPITDDGHFLAYKSVRQDFTDHHTGTMDNSVGSIVSMQRNLVDENKDQTCSYGLHFAAHEYAEGFGSSGRMVVLKINPKDVVAIPSDYKNMKGRACRYEILEEVERSDKGLVNAQVVITKEKTKETPKETPKETTKKLTVSNLVIGKTYEFRGTSFNSSFNGDWFTGEYIGKDKLRLSKVSADIAGQPHQYFLSNVEVREVTVVTYSPQSDNYDDTTTWTDEFMGIKEFVGGPEDFPINRKTRYDLTRHSNGKEYLGFFFTNYDEKNDNLVFRKHNGESFDYCTIGDVSGWEITVDEDHIVLGS